MGYPKTDSRDQNSGDAAVSQWTPERMRLAGLAGIVGGVLWALWPIGTEVFLIDPVRTDSQAVAAVAYALFPLLPAVLIMLGLAGLHQFYRRTYGRIGLLGVTVSAGGLALMATDLALEGVDIFLFGGTTLSDIAHRGFFVGFLVLLLGSIALGVGVWRADRLFRAHWLELLLAMAILAGIAMALLKESIVPTPVNSDLWFRIAFTTAYGLRVGHRSVVTVCDVNLHEIEERLARRVGARDTRSDRLSQRVQLGVILAAMGFHIAARSSRFGRNRFVE